MIRYRIEDSNGTPVLSDTGGTFPVAKAVDVLVAGGGTAGFVAAIASARNGAKTLMVERYGFLGGTLTAALVNTPGEYLDSEGEPVVGGIPWEITKRVAEAGAGAYPRPVTPSGSGTSMAPFDPEVYKVIAAEMVDESGVRQLLHTWASDAIVIDGVIRGIFVENKSGRQVILAKVVIDATGDADVAARAGALCEIGRPQDGRTASGTMLFRLGNVQLDKLIAYMKAHPEDLILSESPHVPKADLSQLDEAAFIAAAGFFSLLQKARENGDFAGRDRVAFISMPYRKNEVVVNTADVPFANGADAEARSAAELEGRRQAMKLFSFFRRYMPGFEDAYLIDMAAETGIRESRRVVGDYMLTKEDVLACRRFEDSIGRGAYHVNLHIAGKTHHIFPKRYYGLPYTVMLPRGLEGLLVAGRCASATHEGGGALRGELNCMVMGEAAGVAAALSARDGIHPRALPIHRLQDALRKQGVLI